MDPAQTSTPSFISESLLSVATAGYVAGQSSVTTSDPGVGVRRWSSEVTAQTPAAQIEVPELNPSY